ncbi:hypothetical protein B4U79_19201, partial [Dinothrombium tinctorium]
ESFAGVWKQNTALTRELCIEDYLLTDNQMKRGLLRLVDGPVFTYAKLTHERKPDMSWDEFAGVVKASNGSTSLSWNTLTESWIFAEKQTQQWKKANKLECYKEASAKKAARNSASWFETQVRPTQRFITVRNVNTTTKTSSPTPAYKTSPKQRPRTFHRKQAAETRQKASPEHKISPLKSQAPRCYACNKPGHLARDCRTNRRRKQRSSSSATDPNSGVKSKFRNQFKKRVKPTSRKTPLPSIIPSLFIGGSVPGVEAIINGNRVNVMLDTGCEEILMSAKCAQKCGLKINTPAKGKRFVGPSKENLKYIGTTKCLLRLADSEVTLRFHVIRKLASDILLGSNFFKKHEAIVDFIKGRISFTVGPSFDSGRSTICVEGLSLRNFPILSPLFTSIGSVDVLKTRI